MCNCNGKCKGNQTTSSYSYFSLFGICFDQACKDAQKSSQSIANAEAQALSSLNQPVNETPLSTYIGYGIAASALLVTLTIVAYKLKK